MILFDEERRVRGGGALDSQWDFEVLGVHGMTLATVFYVFYVGIQFLPSGRPVIIARNGVADIYVFELQRPLKGWRSTETNCP
jgi:hypothetical protein